MLRAERRVLGARHKARGEEKESDWARPARVWMTWQSLGSRTKLLVRHFISDRARGMELGALGEDRRAKVTERLGDREQDKR